MGDWKAVSYPIYGGVDTKISGTVLPAPKLQRAENVYSDQTGSLRRRFGRTALTALDQGGAAISLWSALTTYQGRLVGFAGNDSSMYEYSESDLRWTYRGRSASWREATTPITAPSAAAPAATNGQNCADVAATDLGWRLYAYDLYETSGANIKSTTYLTLFDAAGGRYKSDFQLATSTNVAARTSGVRVVQHGGKFYVIYALMSTLTTLKCFIVDPTSATTLAASFAAAATNLTTALVNQAFDVEENTVYGPFCAFAATPASNTITFGFVNASGAMASASTTSSGAVDALRIAVDVANGNAMHGIAYLKGTTPTDVFACLRSWSGAAWTATATSAATMTGITSAGIGHLTCKFDNATTLRMVFDGDLNVTLPCVRNSVFDTGGFVLDGIAGFGRLSNSYVASKPFATGMGTCYWAANSGQQSTLFLMRVDSNSDPVLVGVADQGNHATVVSGAIQVPRVDGHNALLYPSFFFVSRSVSVLGRGSFWKSYSGTVAMHEISIDDNNPQNRVCVEDGASLFVPSAFLGYFDGKSVVEVGFLQYVDTVVPTPGGGGALDNGVDYFYRIVPEWVNAQGEREQGTDVGPLKVSTVGGGVNSVALVINTLPWTLKTAFNVSTTQVPRNELVFAIYRTEGAPASADDPHYRVGSVKNNPAADTVSFVDLMSDANAVLKEQLYADTELSAIAPPPGYVLSAGNGRILVAGLPDDPSLIVYSKTRGHGVPAAFNAVLQIQMPISAGPIVSTAVLDEQIVVFTPTSVFRVVGSGLNNVGLGSGYAEPVVVVAADGGAISHRPTAVTPIGLLYQSSRGVMLFGADLQGSYVGAPLEGIIAAGALSRVVVQPNLQLIHCVHFSATYVYDYHHRQWYVWTHGSAGPAVLWNDELTGLQDDLAHTGTRTAWTDGTDHYTAKLVLGWEKLPASMQGDVSFRRVLLTGQSLDAHYLDVQVADDYDATTTQTSDVVVAAAGVLRTRFRVARQKANALQVTVQDALVDAYGGDVVQDTAGFRLNEVTFEVAVRGDISSRRVT